MRDRERVKKTVCPASLHSHRQLHSTGEMCLHHHMRSRHPAEGTANSRNTERRRRATSPGETRRGAPTQLGFLTFLAAFQRGQSLSIRAELTFKRDHVPASRDQRLNSSLIKVYMGRRDESFSERLKPHYPK